VTARLEAMTGGRIELDLKVDPTCSAAWSSASATG
jgi:hypothetical protein